MARRRDDPSPTVADDNRVRIRVVVSLLAGALAAAALVGTSDTATAGRTGCAQGNGGYTYAGHQGAVKGHGVRATITATRSPEVESGHVSGWVGVGGPGQGANGEDAWIQVGLAALHGVEEPFLYAEIARGGRQPQFVLIENGVEVGETPRPRRARDVGPAGLVAGLGRRQPGDEGSTSPRLVGSLGADRDRGELERRPGGLQPVRVPVRAGLGRVRSGRLVEAVRPRAPLPRPRLRAAGAGDHRSGSQAPREPGTSALRLRSFLLSGVRLQPDLRVEVAERAQPKTKVRLRPQPGARIRRRS